MNTKMLATTIVFAALTVALNPAISGIGIPAPYAPYLIYGLWEIPIVTAFLLISPTSAVAISLVNATVLFALFPGFLPMGPFYNLIAIFSMLLGLDVARRFIKRKSTLQHQKAVLKIAAASTVLGIILRVAVMTLVNYITLQQPYPIGFELDEIAIVATLPLTAIFNATTVLYTIPIGEFVATVIKSRLRIES